MGCGASRRVAPLVVEVDPGVLHLLVDARLVTNMTVLTALSASGATVYRLREFHASGRLRALLRDLGIQSEMALAAIEEQLDMAGTDDVKKPPKAPRAAELRAEAVPLALPTAPAAHSEVAAGEVAAGEAVISVRNDGSKKMAASRATWRQEAARVTSQVMHRVADTKGQVQDGADMPGQAQDTLAPLSDVLSASGVAESLQGLIQSNTLFKDVQDVLLSAASHVLQSLEHAPLVAPIAKLTSNILAGVAQAMEVKAVLGDFAAMVRTVTGVLVKAYRVLDSKGEALRDLHGVLQEAEELVGQVRNRTWVWRFLRAGKDIDGIKGLGDKLMGAVHLLTADTALESAADIKDVQARLARIMEEGCLASQQELRASLAAAAGVSDAGSLTEEQVARVVADPQAMARVFQSLSAGEKVIVAQVQREGAEVRAAVAVVASRIDLLMEQLVDMLPPEVRRLPERLRELWAGEAGMELSGPSVAWSVFAEVLPDLPCAEGLREWAASHLRVALEAFLDAVARPALAPDGTLTAVSVHVLAKRAQLAHKVPKDAVDVRMCFLFLEAGAKARGDRAPRKDLSRAAPSRRGMAAVGATVLASRVAGAGDAKGDGAGGLPGSTDGAILSASERAELYAALAPCDFAGDAFARSTGYMEGTRAWLQEEVVSWAHAPPSGTNSSMFLLMSLPGMGKTAFAAHVAEELMAEDALAAGHFCRAGDALRSDPRAVVDSLAYQVALSVPGAGSLIHAALRGLPENATPSQACSSLLVETLASAPVPAKPMVVIIDALDEAGATAAANGLLSLVAGELTKLPAWVKLLVTTRPEPFIVSRLSAFAPVVLAPDERRNREDVRAFIEGSLRRDGLTEEERAGAAAAIQERSEGVFAYVASVVRMVQEGGSLGKVTVGQLPTGHRALYTAYLDRQFGSGALGETECRVVRSCLLPAICVAREPLSPGDLARIAQAWASQPGSLGALSEAQARQAVTALGSLFPIGTDGLVRPFHKSVVDWLLEDSSSHWHVTLAQGHLAHACAWAPLLSALSARTAAEGPPTAPGYALRHGLFHVRCGDVFIQSDDGCVADEALGTGAQAWPMWDSLSALCSSMALAQAMAVEEELGELVKEVMVAAELLARVGRGVEAVVEMQGFLRAFSRILLEAPLAVGDVAALSPVGSHPHLAHAALGGGPLMRVARGMDRFPESLALTGHEGNVSAVAFAWDGAVAVTGAHDKSVRSWRVATGAPWQTFSGYMGRITSCVLLPGTRVGCVGSSNIRTLRVWDWATGQLVHSLERDTHTPSLSPGSLAPLGHVLASAGMEGRTLVWDVDAGALLATLEGHMGPVSCLAWVVGQDEARRAFAAGRAPEGPLLLATGAEDATVRVYDAVAGAAVAVLGGHHGQAITCLLTSANGATLVSASLDGTAAVWDLSPPATFNKQRTVRQGAPVRAADLHAAGVVLGLGDSTGNVTLWDVQTGERLADLTGHGDVVSGVAFVPFPGTSVVTSGWDGSVRMHAVPGGELLQELDVGSDPVLCLTLGPFSEGRGVLVGCGTADGAVRVWGPVPERPAAGAAAGGRRGPVVVLAVSEDGALIVTGHEADRDEGGAVAVWDVATGRGVTPGRHESNVRAAAFAANGDAIASGGEDETVCLWRLADQGSGGRAWEAAACVALGAEVAQVLWGPGPFVEAMIAAATDDRRVHLVRGASGEVLWASAALGGLIGSLRWALGGAALLPVASGDSSPMPLLDGRTGQAAALFSAHTDRVQCVAVSDDGGWAATGSSDRSVRVWRLAQDGEGGAPTAGLACTLEGHSHLVFALAFAPGRTDLLASGSFDSTAMVWDAWRGVAVAPALACAGPVGSLAFSPDGALLATAGSPGSDATNEGRVRVWRVATGDLLGVVDLQCPCFLTPIRNAPNPGPGGAPGAGRWLRVHGTTNARHLGVIHFQFRGPGPLRPEASALARAATIAAGEAAAVIVEIEAN